ncbi:MAG: lysine--tRNA ligase [Candidatus Omnitrophica bacterium]|nr:lysine--tRNA ligase [Candidatus Omnitrophota bacterium]
MPWLGNFCYNETLTLSIPVASNDQTVNRRDKFDALKRQGRSPFDQRRFHKGESIRELVNSFTPETLVVSTAGRLSAIRGHGGLIFGDLRDATGKIQISVKRDAVGETAWSLFEHLDLGDIIGVTGPLFKTKTGEVTVAVDSVTLLAKALRPMPEKWHGLKDVEVRYRKRYLDLIANEPVRRVFEQRARLLASLRRTLDAGGFLEVETPMMHAIPGGAAGEPFVTHHKALDVDLYMRLAPELHLKRLLVGGFDRVYEMNRSFRNEGISSRHNPEFTMLEAYQAYWDCRDMMELVERLIKQAAQDVLGTLTFQYQERTIDLSPSGSWPKLSFTETMQQLGLSPDSSQEQIQRVLEKKGIKLKGLTRSQLVRLTEQLIEQFVEPQSTRFPLFVVDYWTELSPLAKSKADNPLVADRFELFIGGMEVANAYSEQNDPIEQRRRFEAQRRERVQGSRVKVQGKNLEPRTLNLERQIDEDFLEALEYGMPPAGGLGVGVDRLAMLLFNQPSIKDVILFPLLKPSEGSRDAV